MITRLVTVLVAISLASSSAVGAQERHRSGLWAEVGFGTGISRVSCSTCDKVVARKGASSNFRIGGSVSNNVLWAFDNFSMIDRSFGFQEGDEYTAETTTAALSALWFPGRSGLFVKGGAGLARAQFSVDASDSEPTVVVGTGFGLTFGLGYDIPLSRKIALTFNAGALITAIGDVILPSGRIDDVIPTSYQLTVGITFR